MSFSYGSAITVKILTTAVSTLGIVIQRKSHVLNDALPVGQRKNSLKRPLWHLGFWLYIVCSLVGSVFSISSLPVLVIAPLGTFTLVFNAIYAHYLLHEDMTWMSFVGTLIIASASAGIAIILHVPSPPRDSKTLLQLLLRKEYIIYISLTMAIVVVLMVTGYICIKKLQKWLLQYEEEEIDSTIKQRKSLIIAVLFETVATSFASQALIFAKITYELLEVSIKSGKNQFKEPVSQAALVVTAIFSLAQLFFFNISLHYYSTIVIIPIGYSIGIVLAYVNTLVYYDSFQKIEIWKSVVVALLVLVVVSGIYILSTSKPMKPIRPNQLRAPHVNAESETGVET